MFPILAWHLQLFNLLQDKYITDKSHLTKKVGGNLNITGSVLTRILRVNCTRTTNDQHKRKILPLANRKCIYKSKNVNYNWCIIKIYLKINKNIA